MCGHGSIGIITFGLEQGLIRPRTPGKLRVEVPAGVIDVTYEQQGDRVTSVRLRNVPAYLAAQGIAIDVPGFGPAVDRCRPMAAIITRSSSRRAPIRASTSSAPRGSSSSAARSGR